LLELINTLATLGTFLVIAATAVAAIIQLRHARSSNQLAAINELRANHQTPEFTKAVEFLLVGLSDRLADPEFRHALADRSAQTHDSRPDIDKIGLIANSYEVMGVLVRTGLVDKRIVLDIWSNLVVIAWEKLAPVTAILRRKDESIWENFEYLAMLSQDFIAAYPRGTYPAGFRRLPLNDVFAEADARYKGKV
jgi:Domain of unknown function (DUF4760)